MLDGWYALCIAILIENTTIEQAFQLYNTGKRKRLLTEEDTKDMIKLKETCTFKEISYIYGGITESSLCNRIMRYKG